MKCPKCEGRGWYENPKWIGGGSASEGISPSFKCKKCKESGYIIGNVKDVLDFLNFLKAQYERVKDSHMLEQVKQCIDTIEKH